MRLLLFYFLFALCLVAGNSMAGEPTLNDPSELSPRSDVKFSYETEADAGYVSGARTNFGNKRTGKVSEQNSLVRLVAGAQRNDEPIYRFGLEWQRSSFGLSRSAPLPNTLQEVGAVIGMDFQLFNSWLIRIEAQPGIYSDFQDVRWSDFNAPFILGASYVAGADVQWIIGVSVDVNRHYPLLGAIGVRWKFAEKWVLNAVAPTPRLEFEAGRDLTLFAGAELSGGTYRVSSNLGKAQGIGRPGNAIVEYDEIRIGGGLSWKASSDFTLDAEAGYLPYREFDFHRPGISYRNKSGAPYVQASVTGKF